MSNSPEQTVAVIISSFGDRKPWNHLAMRALASVSHQRRPPDAVHRIHHETLCQARNEGAFIANADWLCFLDCDDELEPFYLMSMMKAAAKLQDGAAALLYPRVRYVEESPTSSIIPEPTDIPRVPILKMNFMVIGTLVRRDMFLDAEGFRDIPVYEDWDLWIRCCILGAEPQLVPGAIYRAYQHEGSRNSIRNHPAAVQYAKDVSHQIREYNKEWQPHRAKVPFIPWPISSSNQ